MNSTVGIGCIQTGSGGYVNLLDPDPDTIQLSDIAAGLSKLCRFSGQCRQFYSVAQHSCLCAYYAPPELAWHALMHDAAEAYIGDMARPLKQLMPEYKRIEQRLESVIFEKYNVRVCDEVKRLDLQALATERRDLMPATDERWAVLDGVEPWNDTILGWSPESAERYFSAWIQSWEAQP